MDLKRSLRHEMKELLRLMDHHEREAFSHDLELRLRTFLKNHFSGQNPLLGVFAPLDDEPNLLPFLKSPPCSLAFVRFKSSGEMEFAQCGWQQLEEAPIFKTKKLFVAPKSIPQANPTVLLVPGLAFSLKGERLGRGKGFYDRYLESFSGVTVGVCFDFQIKEFIPLESHDKKVDFVITPKREIIVKFN